MSMRRSLVPLALICLALVACQSTSELQAAAGDPGQREALFAPLRGLEGRWEGVGADGEKQTTEFKVSSAGHALREIMFAGTSHEMTNMYTLDGNSLVMTHYCAGGNQPRMRATAVEGGSIAFRFDGVADLDSDDQLYMGEMTLSIVDADHIQEKWRAFKGDEIDHEMTFDLTRVR